MTDAIEKIMGGFGRYQLFLFLMISICKFFVAFNQMAIIFLAPKVSYTCNGQKDVCPCPNPEYDTSVFTSTIVTEWNLICDRNILVSVHQSMVQLGTLIGSILFGIASDRFGRLRPFLFAVLCQIILGISAAFIPSYYVFTFVRFLIGVTLGGTMVTSFVLLMEFVGIHYREIIGAMYHFPFNMGHMILPLLSYLFNGYKEFLLAISLPSLVMLPYFILLPESPRWLLAMKRTDDSIRTIEKVAKLNKRDTTNIKTTVEEFQAFLESHKLQKRNIIDLFRTPNIRKRIIIMALDWLTCGLCFYGISQYVGQLSGNIFLNVFICAMVAGSGCLISIPLMKVSGRKTIVVCNNYICATCLIILGIIPSGTFSVILATTGVLSAFITFLVVYLYTAELFPTVVRNAAIGFSSMSARIGSMLAPFVIELGQISKVLPPLVFAIPPLICGTLSLMLPETKGHPLMTTIEESEQFGKKNSNKR